MDAHVADRHRVAQEAAAAAAEAIQASDVNALTLSSGVVLRLRPVPPFALRQAELTIPRPKPPIVHIESKNRDEENVADPGYLQALEDREAAVYEAGVNVSLIMGTDVVSVPDGTDGPDGERWLEELDAAGISVDVSTPSRRRLAWIQLYAMRTPGDISALSVAVLSRAGLREEEIALAVASFLSHARRAADRSRDAD